MAAVATLWRSVERLAIAEHLHGNSVNMRVFLNRCRMVCDKDYDPTTAKLAAQPYANIHAAFMGSCGSRQH